MSLTVGKRLVIGFSSLTAVIIGVGGAGVWEIARIKSYADQITQHCLPGGQLSATIESHLRECYGTLAQATLIGDLDEVKAFKAARAQILEQVVSAVSNYEKSITQPDDRVAFDRFKADLDRYVESGNRLLAMASAGQSKEAREYFVREVRPLADKAKSAAAGITKWNADYANRSGEGIAESVTAANAVLWTGTGIGVTVALVLGTLIARSLNRSLSTVAQALSSSSTQVAGASTQVSASSQSLAQGASEQAASLEETSSALNEIASMIKKNADTSSQAASFSEEAKGSADRGIQAMSKMSSAIADIERSSQETAKIIKTIDEIAFQTNLLALNAAVEAARAGEAGKGFAVVAEEVRNLAMRSAEAAKNTSTLIEGSVGKAKNGVSMAQLVGSSLSEINDATTKVTGLIAEIAASSKEQATGIDQITQAVAQMDKVTQTNAANAEETAAASEELNAQAQQLQECVSEMQRLVGLKADAATPANQQYATRHAHQSRKRSTPTTPSERNARHLIPLEAAEASAGDFADFSKAA